MRRLAIALACVVSAGTYATGARATIVPLPICAQADGDAGDCDGGIDASVPGPDSGPGGADAAVPAPDAAVPAPDGSTDASVRQDTTLPGADTTASMLDAGPPLRFDPVRLPTASSPNFEDEACAAGGTRSPWGTLAAFGITVLALARLRRKRR